MVTLIVICIKYYNIILLKNKMLSVKVEVWSQNLSNLRSLKIRFIILFLQTADTSLMCEWGYIKSL